MGHSARAPGPLPLHSVWLAYAPSKGALGSTQPHEVHRVAGPAASEHGVLRPSTWACCTRAPVPAACDYLGLLLPSIWVRFV